MLIHDLPVEVLFHIIIKGIEDEILPFPHWEETQSQRAANVCRMKPFVRTVRRVCHNWRNLTDHAPRTRRIRFWKADLRLTLDHSGVRQAALAKEIIRFRNCLHSSRGCDLTVTFEIKDMEDDWWHEMNDLPVDDKVLTKLFVYGINLLLPFCEQIVYLSAEVPQPQIANSCLQLLAHTSSQDYSRLAALRLVYLPPQHPQRPWDRSLIEIYNGAGEGDTNTILKNATAKPAARRQFSLLHLRSLDTLTITHISWLKEIQLPLNLRSLIISNAPGVAGLIQILSPITTLRDSLTSLTLYGPGRQGAVGEVRLALPRLRKLTILSSPYHGFKHIINITSWIAS